MSRLYGAQGVKPNFITFSTFIFACGKAGKAQQALRVFDEMIASGVEPNVAIFCAVVHITKANAYIHTLLFRFECINLFRT